MCWLLGHEWFEVEHEPDLLMCVWCDRTKSTHLWVHLKDLLTPRLRN